MRRHETRSALSRANPVEVTLLGDSSRTAEGEALLLRIVAEADDPPIAAGGPAVRGAVGQASPARPALRGRWVAVPTRWRLITVGTLAVATALAVLVTQLPGGHGTGAAYAATPPMLRYHAAGKPAAKVLDDLAARITGQPDTTGTGDVRYVRVRRWLLVPTLDADRGTGGAAVTADLIETWLAGDGAGQVLRTPGGVRAEGTGQALPPGSKAAEATAETGSGRFTEVPLDLAALPQDPVALANWLDQRPDTKATGSRPSSVAARRIGGLRAVWDQQPVPPEVQARFLRVLADTPGLVDEGTVTDRAGRSGRAVAVEADEGAARVRHVLILDPGTGAPLGYEKILLTERGQEQWTPLQPVRVPAVVEYVAYLAAARVATVGGQP